MPNDNNTPPALPLGNPAPVNIPYGKIDGRTQDPANFTPEAIENRSVPDFGHPIANHVYDIMQKLGRGRSK